MRRPVSSHLRLTLPLCLRRSSQPASSLIVKDPVRTCTPRTNVTALSALPVATTRAASIAFGAFVLGFVPGMITHDAEEEAHRPRMFLPLHFLL